MPSSSSNESKSEKLSLGFKLPCPSSCGESSAPVALLLYCGNSGSFVFRAWRMRESHLVAGP